MTMTISCCIYTQSSVKRRKGRKTDVELVKHSTVKTTNNSGKKRKKADTERVAKDSGKKFARSPEMSHSDTSPLQETLRIVFGLKGKDSRRKANPANRPSSELPSGSEKTTKGRTRGGMNLSVKSSSTEKQERAHSKKQPRATDTEESWRAETDGLTKDNRAGTRSQSAKIACRESRIRDDVSLSAAVATSGVITRLGKVPAMRKCVELSCEAGGDIAYLLHRRCYVIHCHAQKACEPRPLKSRGAGLRPLVAFLTRGAAKTKMRGG